MSDATALDVAKEIGLTGPGKVCPGDGCIRKAGHQGSCVDVEEFKRLKKEKHNE